MALILGKKTFGRLETLQYANKKFGWPSDVIIGIGQQHGFWAWLLARLTRRECVYYCIDFYSPEIADDKLDSIFIWAAMQMDKFLVRHADDVWDISVRIQDGRLKFGRYMAYLPQLAPLSYPPSYFRFEKHYMKNQIIFVGIQPYGLELMNGLKHVDLCWPKNLPLDELLFKVSHGQIGISMWNKKGNNYYGDPGKTKLYSACGLPVIMTDDTHYADVIKETGAGLVIDYNIVSLYEAINEITKNYSYYKNNVKKTWEYIDASKVFKNTGVLVR